MYAKSTEQSESQSLKMFTQERKTFSFQRKLRSKHLFFLNNTQQKIYVKLQFNIEVLYYTYNEYTDNYRMF